MPPAARAAQPSVFALLAAQVAAVRDRIETDATGHLDLLWKAADTTTQLVALLDRLSRYAGILPPDLAAACASAETAKVELGRALDELAFAQAQRMDLSRQMADAVVLALRCLEAGDTSISAEQIATVYVSQEQRAVHAAALQGRNDA
jgi:hypothetical protein